MSTTEQVLYSERLTSNRTLALFAALTLGFGGLGYWRVTAVRTDGWAIVFIVLSSIFAFYSVNYRTLLIRLTSAGLVLKFGVFRWQVPADNIADCRLDSIPSLKRLGGAGIHFMTVEKRYRVSFNFLEYPRVTVNFKRKTGPVSEISFSTRHPEELIRCIRAAAAATEKG